MIPIEWSERSIENVFDKQLMKPSAFTIKSTPLINSQLSKTKTGN